jgi:cytochrome P450
MVSQSQFVSSGKDLSMMFDLYTNTVDVYPPSGLTRNELLHQVIAFLTAGSEATTNTLIWFIHYISKHPRVQQKIKAELMKNTGNKQYLSSDCLDALVYLDAVINEILRLSPPFDGTYRTLTIDDRLPKSNVQLYKGDQVYISFGYLGRHPQYWSIDPELFYPERFFEDDKSHHPYALLPFGSGHRHCVGEDLARFELKVIIARLMQHVTFGDGGPELNAGGQMTILTTIPNHVGVTIKFD